jgi:hypothetical protein
LKIPVPILSNLTLSYAFGRDEGWITNTCVANYFVLILFRKETAEDEDDEEITSESEAGSGEENLDTSVSSSKQSVKSSEVPQLIAKRHRAVEKYR